MLGSKTPGQGEPKPVGFADSNRHSSRIGGLVVVLKFEDENFDVCSYKVFTEII